MTDSAKIAATMISIILLLTLGPILFGPMAISGAMLPVVALLSTKPKGGSNV